MILFFIPSFNDQEIISDLVNSLLNLHTQATVLVVDDGSKVPIDIKVDPLLSNRTFLYRLETNAGLGLATSIAIDFFLDGPFKAFVRVDADGQHPLSEVNALYQPVLNGLADIVWAERRSTSESTPSGRSGIWRDRAKALTCWLAQRAIGCSHSDWFSGFFALSPHAAQSFQLDYLERYCEVQMLCLAYVRHLRIRTVLVHQIDRAHGESTIRLFGGLMVVLRAWLLILMYASGRERR
jgi:glycosyltransferase involved in cell wall biosynthesis